MNYEQIAVVKKDKWYWCKNKSDTYDVILMLTLECLQICLEFINILFSGKSETMSRSHTILNIAKHFEKNMLKKTMMPLKLTHDASWQSDLKRYF